MYLKHFSLNHHPFHNTLEEEPFFTGGHRGPILDGVLYALATGEGMIQVTGEAGAGKSYLARELCKRLPEGTPSLFIGHPAITAAGLLERIAKKRQLAPLAGESLAEKITALKHQLQCAPSSPPLVIVVDEAQGLAQETLETLRHISDLDQKRKRVAQVLLLGTPQLEIILSRQENQAIGERIVHRFPLPPLERQEVANYLAFRLRLAGGDPAIFTSSSLRVMTRQTGGLMRRIDILAHKAMLTAFARGRKRVLGNHVELAYQTSGFSAADNKQKEITQPDQATPWWRSWSLPWPSRRWAMPLVAGLVVMAGTASGALLFQDNSLALEGLLPEVTAFDQAPPQVIVRDLPMRPLLSSLPGDDCGLTSGPLAYATPMFQTAEPAKENKVQPKQSLPEVAGKSTPPARTKAELTKATKEASKQTAPVVAGKSPPSPAPSVESAQVGKELGKELEKYLADGKTWLKRARSKTYTIQLMVVEDEATMNKVKTLPAKGLRMLPTAQGKHLVILGEYPTYEKAKASLATLAPDYLQSKPFVLKIQDLRRKISQKGDKNEGKSA